MQKYSSIIITIVIMGTAMTTLSVLLWLNLHYIQVYKPMTTIICQQHLSICQLLRKQIKKIALKS